MSQADTLELPAALDAAGPSSMAGRAALLDAQAAGTAPSAPELAALHAQHEADSRDLDRLVQRIGHVTGASSAPLSSCSCCAMGQGWETQ
ncbi:MAG: hypothetical protein AB7I50_22145 [Vicinamibacterales bacterium]